ncbi:hypothetical protein [Kushneria phosphatilytica]|uniref:Uncharacterized protein n=1 Tax=Kushneria phosphatilytica TaxID=657387 RepID=A0A1S1NN32_9GAMM|nr:hypothetical protein [Kushneria phosphatilytica]OHV08717.1 hypothetical protein BH688_11880 [Kushneria phosphatilytica]QEL12440.1 hypothetical protein FY550_15695 [Kushneria phosphatilytica]
MKLDRYHAQANANEQEYHALRARLVEGSYIYQMFARLDRLERDYHELHRDCEQTGEIWAQCSPQLREQLHACGLGELLDRMAERAA